MLGALGLVQKYERVGLALMMARYTKDKASHHKAVIGVMAQCSKLAPKYVGAIKERGQGMALKAIAALALQHYCRMVDTPGAACHPQFCRGGGAPRSGAEPPARQGRRQGVPALWRYRAASHPRHPGAPCHRTLAWDA